MTAPRRWLLVACAVTLSACASAGGSPPTPTTTPRPAAPAGMVNKRGEGPEPPVLVKEIKPNYTRPAMDAKIEWSVWLQCIVTPQGLCTDIKVVRSLDRQLGLDHEAITALRQWRYIPGTKDHEPLLVRISIELTFKLKQRVALRVRSEQDGGYHWLLGVTTRPGR